MDKIVAQYDLELKSFKGDIKTIQSDLLATEKTGVQSANKIGNAFEKAGAKMQGETKKTGSSFGQMAGTIGASMAGMGIALGVNQVIQFGKASVEAFVDAEKNAQLLLFALHGNEGAQKRLLAQATELQNTTIFDDDTIQQGQTFLANQGRTEEQIKKVISAAVELSTVTGVDLNTAVMQLDATFEGNIGRMGKLDSGFKNLTKEQLANGAAADLLIQKYGGTAVAMGETTAGAIAKLKNQFGELQETIGEKLTPTLTSLLEGLTAFGKGDLGGGIDGLTKSIEVGLPFVQEIREAYAAFADGKFWKGLANSGEAVLSLLTLGFYTRVKNYFSPAAKIVGDGYTDFEKAKLKVINATDGEIAAEIKLRKEQGQNTVELEKYIKTVRESQIKETFEELASVLEITTKQYEKLVAISDKYGISARINSSLILDIKTSTEEDLNNAFLKFSKTLNVSKEDWDEYIGSVKGIKPLHEDVSKSTTKMVGPYDALNAKIALLNKQMLDAITLGKDYSAIEHELIDLTRQKVEIDNQAARSLTSLNEVTLQRIALAPLEVDASTINFEALQKENRAKLDGVLATVKLNDATSQGFKNKKTDLSNWIKANQVASDLFQAMEQQDIINAGDNEKKKLQIRKAYAVPEFLIRTSEIVASTAAAVMNQYATLPLPAAAIATGFIVAEGIIQEAVAASALANVLALAQGTDRVMGGIKGKDSVPAILMPDEAVIQSNKNMAEPGLSKAWNSGNLNEYVMSRWVAPALKEQEKQMQADFATRMATSMLIQQGQAFDDMRLKRALDEGNNINKHGFKHLIDALGKTQKKRGGYA